MIGPTSTFYDPDVFAQQQQRHHDAQYQQWVATFSGQQQRHASHQQRSQESFQISQQQIYPQSNLHTQYDSVPLPYPAPQYSRTGAGISTHSNAGQTVTDETSYHQLSATTAHYSQPGTTTHTPDLSYSTTPDPLHQEMGFQRHPHQQSQSQFHYSVPSSELAAHLQANPRSMASSLSPASNAWTDEVRSSSASLRPSTTSSLSNAMDDNLGKGTADPQKSNPGSDTTPVKIKKGTSRPSGLGRPSPPSVRQAGNSGRTSEKRKRAKKTKAVLETQLYQFEPGSGSDSDEDLGINMSQEGGISVGMGGLGVVTSAAKVGKM